MLAAIFLLLHLSLLVRNSASRFTQAVCRPTTRLCVQRNTANTSWCYVPGAVDTVATDCIGDHLDLANVVKVHAAQDLSIAYYNGADDKLLGGADWPFPIGAGIYRLCVSGRAGEGLVQTLCFNVAGDNTLDGNPYCSVTYGPQVVSDGCYLPETRPTPTASSGSISSTPSPPSSSSSKNSPSSSLSSTGTGSLSPQGTSSASATTIIIDNSHKTNKAATIAAPVVLGIAVFIALIVILVLYDKNQLLQRQVLLQGRDPGGRY